MYPNRNFDPIQPGESELFGFDFKFDLADAESLTGATWSCRVAPTSKVADADAASRLSGLQTLQGTETYQRVTGCIAGVLYILEAAATTSKGNTIKLWSRVLCQESF